MDKIITEDEFYAQFKPKANPYTTDAPWNNCMLETYGREESYVIGYNVANPDQVWTVLDCDGQILVASGYHYVNRMGYIITEVPVSPGDLVTVYDPDDADEESEED